MNNNYEKLNDPMAIIFESDDISAIKEALNYIKSEKEKNDEITDYYMILCYLESTARHKLVILDHCPIEKTKYQLTKSLSCNLMAELCCQMLGYDNHSLEKLGILHQTGVILYDLYKFAPNPLSELETAIEKFEYVKENVDENSEIHKRALINECNSRAELVRIKHDSKEICLNTIKFIEESKKYFNKNDEEYKTLFLNFTNLISNLIKYEPYGLGVEFYETMQKLFRKYDQEGLLEIYLDLKLIDLGYRNPNELDKNIKKIQDMKENLPYEKEEYHDCTLLEGDLLFKKALYENELHKKILFLYQCIEIYAHYREVNSFDRYYSTKTLFKEAHVRLELSRLNNRKEYNLNIAKDLLLKAKEYYEIVPFQNNDLNLPIVLLNLAKVEKEINLANNTFHENYKIIKKYLIESIDYFQRNIDEEQIIECYTELGEILYLNEKYEDAFYYLKKGVDLAELMRNSILNHNLKNLFYEKTSKLYELIILTSHKLNRFDDTLKYLEFSKYRGFVEKISENQQNHFVKKIDEKLFSEMKSIEQNILNILDELKKIDENNFKFYSNYTKLYELRKQERNCLKRIKKEFPQYYDYHYNQYFDYKTFNLKDAALIEYYYTEDILLIFLIEDNELTIKEVNIENNLLSNNINKFNEKLKESNIEECLEKSVLEIEKIMENLYEILFKPIKSKINKNKLIITPHNELYTIPFYCLKKQEKYLIDSYTIMIAQSGLSIEYLKNNTQYQNLKDALVIGIEDELLSHTKEEVEIISKELNTKPIFNKNATKENVLNLIEGKQIIHYAGHGYFDLENPSLSYIQLIDENLHVKDIMNMNINSELITLSACETGIITPKDNEINTFISTLQIEGVKYIVASLWRIFDDSSKELFEHFYKNKKEYPERLRSAQLHLKEKNMNLLKWGAFQIYGL